MKKILFSFLIVFCFSTQAQTQKKSAPSGLPNTNTQSQAKKKYSTNTTQNLVSTLLHEPCLNKEFSIVFYVILDSTSQNMPGYPGIGNATPSNLSQAVTYLNKNFSPICVSFKNCSTVYIPNYSYGLMWHLTLTEKIVTNTWYTDKTINIFLVDSINMDGTSFLNKPAGYAHGPGGSSTQKNDVIVLRKTELLPNLSEALITHEMGHFFGLLHTFDEISATTSLGNGPSLELPDASNCSTTGDGICDTEADPGDISILKNTQNNMYNHPIDNFMSYYPSPCRFTTQQYNRMADVILTQRFYLH